MGVRNIMKIEVDPAKDEANIAKHGVSLRVAAGFDWDTAFEREDDRFDYGEVRFVALGLIGDRLHVLVFTEGRSEEHTSELQSLMRISYAVFCLKKKNKNNKITTKKMINNVNNN